MRYPRELVRYPTAPHDPVSYPEENLFLATTRYVEAKYAKKVKCIMFFKNKALKVSFALFAALREKRFAIAACLATCFVVQKGLRLRGSKGLRLRFKMV